MRLLLAETVSSSVCLGRQHGPRVLLLVQPCSRSRLFTSIGACSAIVFCDFLMLMVSHVMTVVTSATRHVYTVTSCIVGLWVIGSLLAHELLVRY